MICIILRNDFENTVWQLRRVYSAARVSLRCGGTIGLLMMQRHDQVIERSILAAPEDIEH